MSCDYRTDFLPADSLLVSLRCRKRAGICNGGTAKHGLSCKCVQNLGQLHACKAHSFCSFLIWSALDCFCPLSAATFDSEGRCLSKMSASLLKAYWVLKNVINWKFRLTEHFMNFELMLKLKTNMGHFYSVFCFPDSLSPSFSFTLLCPCFFFIYHIFLPLFFFPVVSLPPFFPALSFFTLEQWFFCYSSDTVSV